MATLLMDINFLDPSFTSNSTVSSEQTSFPVDNIYNAQRRSKVWRSNGYWEITDSNKTLIFRETTGVDLTATLTTGSYNSTSSLFAEIKTQLETAGGSVYTIETHTTTSKVKFTSDGAGGGGIFELRWTLSTGLASLLGFASSDDTGALTYTADVLRIASEEWIKWDMGISSNPQAFILIGKRNSPIPISPSSTVTIQGSETDIWDTPSYEQVLTYDDNAISLINADGLHTEALRYWRLKIEDTSNPLGHVEIGALFLGEFFKAVRGATQFPFNAAYIDRSPTVFSEGGQSFSDIKEKTESFSIRWFGLTIEEKEQIDLFWDDYGTSIPFFISLDTDSAFSSTSQYYIRYVKFNSAPNYQLVSPGVYQMSMSIREEL